MLLSDDQKLYAAGALAVVLGGIWWWRKRSVSNDGSDPAATPGGDSGGADPSSFTAEQYPPNDPETIRLFTAAAQYAGLPVEWASSPGLHGILAKESMGGWVGIPNYQFGDAHLPQNRDQWPGIWQAIQDGSWRSLVTPTDAGPSSATGLGQLTVTNINKYNLYPSGLAGIGNAFEEAVGMLRYIQAFYNADNGIMKGHSWFDCSSDMDALSCAWSTYGRGHEGY